MSEQREAPIPTGDGLVAISSLRVPKERAEALEAAFRGRSRLVDQHPGFRRLQLVRARGSGEYMLILHWESLEAFQRYAKSQDFEHAHNDLDGDVTPMGLRIYDMVLDSERGE